MASKSFRSIRLPHVSELDFGVGIESLSGGVRNRVVAPDPSPPQQAGGAAGQKLKLERLTSSEQLAKSLEVEASASYGAAAFGAGVSARFGYISETAVQSESIFLSITCTYAATDLSIDDCQLVPAAADIIDRPDLFEQRYGTLFARACKRGGLFVAVMRIETESSTSRESIEAELQGSYGLFSAQASTKLKTALSTEKTAAYCTIYQEGGPLIQLNDPDNPLELLDLANGWLKAMHEDPDSNSVPVSWSFAPISIANGPAPLNVADVEHAQDVRSFCAEERLRKLDELNLYGHVVAQRDRYDWSTSSVEAVQAAGSAVQQDLDLISACASFAINDPQNAKMPAGFAAMQGTSYPNGLPPAMPRLVAGLPSGGAGPAPGETLLDKLGIQVRMEDRRAEQIREAMGGSQ